MRLKRTLLSASILLVSSPVAMGNLATSADAIGALSDRSAYQITDVLLTSELQRQAQTESLIEQSKVALASELSDTDGDNTLEAPTMRTALAGYAPPTGGGFVPATSIAPKSDGYRMPLGYCVWDNGTSTASADRIAGDNPGSNTSVSFVILSSGKNRVFDTTCADARTGAFSGDDVYALVTVGMGNNGVSTNNYLGRPVANQAALLALDTTNTEPGEIRMVLDEGVIYAWLDLNGDSTFQWEGIGSKSYLYSGDSNGATAGGEYTSTPFSLGIGSRFSDQNLVPDETLEVDGNALFRNASNVDSIVTIESDTGNTNESDNPQLVFKQDGGLTVGRAGLTATDNEDYIDARANALYFESQEGAPGNSKIQFVTGGESDNPANPGTARMTILGNGNIGIGTQFPSTRFVVSGSDNPQTGPVMLFNSETADQVESGRIRFTENGSNFRGGYLHYNGLTNAMSLGVNTDVAGFNPGADKNVLTIPRDSGYVGLNTDTPTSTLHIRSADGDASDTEVVIEADPSNTSESSNPGIKLIQDGDQTLGRLALEGSAGTNYAGSIANATYLEASNTNADSAIQFVTGQDYDLGGSQGTARMTILANGNIGIGTASPSDKLTVTDGNFRMYGDSQYVDIGVFTSPTVATSDDNADGYEHINMGVTAGSGVGFIGSSYGINFFPDIDTGAVTSTSMHLSESGSLGLGTNSPAAQLDVIRDSSIDYNLRLRNPSANAKGLLVSAGTTGKTSSLLKAESADSSQTFFEVTDGSVNVGTASSETEFCLNGECSNSIQTTKKATITLNKDTHTPVAYLNGSKLGNNTRFTFSGNSTNSVVNVDLEIMQGHQNTILMDSRSLGYTQVDFKVEYNTSDEYILSAKLIPVIGTDPVNVDVIATSGVNQELTLAPTNTVTVSETVYHTTQKEAKSLQNLNVRGVASFFNDSGDRPNYYMVGSFEDERSTGAVDVNSGYTLKTKIPGPSNSGGVATMHKIKIEGYAFGTSEIVDMDLGFYVYPSSPGIINVTYSVTGTYFPTKLEIAEGTDGNIWIRFNPGIYKMRFHVSHYNSYGLHTADMSKNWEMDMTQGSLSGMAYFKNFHQDSDGWQMKRFMTTFTAEEGYKNSPVSIRERGYARNSNLDPRWSPNLNFHWENRISRNLWMDADGVLNYGAYDSAGNPTANGKMKMQDLLLDSGANYWPLQINSRAVSGDGQNVGGMAIFPDGDINKRIEYSGKRSGNFRIWTSGNMGDVIWSDGANVHVAGSLFQNSDRRLKTNINGISNALDGIRRIDGKTYNWKTDENGAPVTYGLIAQELESVFPEMVSTADDGTKSVSYNGLIPVLVEATKELDDKVEDIEVKTDRHELKIQEYESRILTLEDQVREYEKRQAGDTAIAPAQPAANDEVMADNEEAHEPAVKPSSGLTRFYGS